MKKGRPKKPPVVTKEQAQKRLDELFRSRQQTFVHLRNLDNAMLVLARKFKLSYPIEEAPT